jgi:cytochrome c553
MLSTVSLVVAGLSTGNKVGLAAVGIAFIVFALISSFVLPQRNPNFPGRGLGWYVALCVLFFVAMISAVLVFGKEKTEAAPNAATTTSAAAPDTSTPPADASATAGKKVFALASCGGCHTLKAIGSTGEIGPNLDQVKPAFDRIVHQVEVGGGPMPAFKGQLSDQQIKDVAAFVYASTHS